jgi:uncharacterized protein YdeI (YjbR/CyaY-like superfamily)
MTEAPANSVQPEDREAWRRWLEQNRARTAGVWLVCHKKSSRQPGLGYEAAVEEALCFGWIDSKANKLDADRFMVWMAPRKPGTGWSSVNKERVARLTAAGRMAPAGQAKVEAAKQDGSWNALDAVEALEIPADLEAALAANETARRNFEAFPRSARKMILGWIASARTPGTRLGRIEETVRRAAENKRANQWRQ